MTRDELIEAATKTLVNRIPTWAGTPAGFWHERTAAEMVDAVLPLLADAIEAQERLPYAMQRYVPRVADVALVRGFLDSKEDR